MHGQEFVFAALDKFQEVRSNGFLVEEKNFGDLTGRPAGAEQDDRFDAIGLTYVMQRPMQHLERGNLFVCQPIFFHDSIPYERKNITTYSKSFNRNSQPATV